MKFQYQTQALENYVLSCHNTQLHILDHDGNLLDIFTYEEKITSFHVTERQYEEDKNNEIRLVGYLGLENGMIYLIHQVYRTSSENNHQRKGKLRKLEAILHSQRNHQLESLHICTCNGSIKTISSSIDLVGVIIEPDKVLILRKSDHSYRYYASVTSKPLHSMCFLSQKRKPEQQIIELLHIDLSFGVDDFLLLGNDAGELEFIRLIPDDSEYQSNSIIEKPTDVSSLITLSPIPSINLCPILMIFIDYPIVSPNSPPLPQLSTNYRTPLLCLINSEGYLLIYQPRDSKVPYLNKTFRLSLVGSCLWKCPQQLDSTHLAISFWNGLILTLSSGILFAFYIRFNPLLQKYFMSTPFSITPVNANYLTFFSISPCGSSIGISDFPSHQFLTLEYSCRSIKTFPLTPLLSNSSLQNDISTHLFTHPLLTQNEYHDNSIQKLLRYFSYYILHLDQHSALSSSSGFTFPLHITHCNESTDEVRDILSYISTSLAVENEVQSLISDIDSEIVQLMSFIEILQSIPSSFSSVDSKVNLPGLTYSLTFDEYSQHDMSYLSVQNDKNIFLGLFSLKTSSELVMKALQGKSVQLSWLEEDKSQNDQNSQRYDSWNHQISFHSKEGVFTSFLVLPLPIFHLQTHYLHVDLIISSTRSLHLFQSSALNPHSRMNFSNQSQQSSILDIKDYHTYQRNQTTNSPIDGIHTNCSRGTFLDEENFITYSLEPIRCDVTSILNAIKGRINTICPSENLHPLVSKISSSHTRTQLNVITLDSDKEDGVGVGVGDDDNHSRLHSLILDEIRRDSINSSTLPLTDHESRKLVSFSATIPLYLDESRHSFSEIEEFFKGIENLTIRHEGKVGFETSKIEVNALEYSSKILSSFIDKDHTEKQKILYKISHRSTSRLLLSLIHSEIRNILLRKLSTSMSEEYYPTSQQLGSYERHEKDIYSLPRDIQQVCNFSYSFSYFMKTLMHCRSLYQEIKSFNFRLVSKFQQQPPHSVQINQQESSINTHYCMNNPLGLHEYNLIEIEDGEVENILHHIDTIWQLYVNSSTSTLEHTNNTSISTST